MASSISGFYLQPKDMNGKWTLFPFFFLLICEAPKTFLSHKVVATLPIAGICPLDTGSETDMEAAIDPLLCHYQGPIASLLRRDNIYSPDPSEILAGLFLLSMWPWIKAFPGVQLQHSHHIQAVSHLNFFF